MSEVMTLPPPAIPVQRKCQIEEVFDGSFLELIRLVPMNPHVRALILKLTGKMPAPECESFEQIKEWVETTCVRTARPSPARTASYNAEGGIVINVEFSETEYGRADYSVPRSGSAEFHLSSENLLEMIREAIEDGDGLDAIVEAVAARIDEDAWSQCDPSLNDSGDYDYSEHEANDSGNSETECSKTEIRNAVLAFVREHHPELAAEL